MSLQQAVHQMWGDDLDLNTLVTVARVFTGRAVDNPTLPYAVLARHQSIPSIHTSSDTRIDQTSLRINIWTTDLDNGKEIAGELIRLFDSAAFDLVDGKVLNMRHQLTTEEIQHDGTWRVAVDFTAIAQYLSM